MSATMIWALILLAILVVGLVLHFRYPQGSRGRRNLRWSLWALVVLIVGAFLDYTLPHHDIVRITDTYNRVTTIGWENSWAYSAPDTGTAESKDTRDIRFINAVYPDDKVVVYRNEDTGWVWPPYFKYDSSNLQAEASNFKSTKEAPKWVSVTYYGWRMPFLSIYPNAVRAKEVTGPDVTIIPWVNFIVLTLLLLGFLMLRRMWLQFRERMVDPVLNDVGDTFEHLDAQAEAARAGARGVGGRIGAWLGTWRSKPRP